MKTMTLHGDHYCCATLRVYDALIMRGCKPIRMVTDQRNPDYKCWIFKIDDRLKSALSDHFGVKVS